MMEVVKADIVVDASKKSLTHIGSASKDFDSEQGMKALFALLGALSSYVLNPDVWWLATRNAKDVAVKQYGVSPEVFDETMKRFEKARKMEAGKSVLKDLF